MQHFSVLQDKKLEKILDTLQARGVSGAEAAKSHLEKTQVNFTTKVKTELLKLHKDYQEPLCTPEKWTEILNYRAKEARERQRQRVIEKHYEGISAELDVETPLVITLPPTPNLPHPKPKVKSKLPSNFDATKYSEANRPVPARSRNPTVMEGK